MKKSSAALHALLLFNKVSLAMVEQVSIISQMGCKYVGMCAVSASIQSLVLQPNRRHTMQEHIMIKDRYTS